MTNKKNGISIRQIKRHGFELCVSVYEKYNRKCSVCGATEKLAIHHMDGSGQSDSPNNDISNLQLICLSCHCRLHTMERWKKNVERRGLLRKGREKEYAKEQNAKYKAKYREELREYNKGYREKPSYRKYVESESYKKRRKECAEEFRLKNPDKIKEYRLKNKDKIKEYKKKYREKNKEKISKYMKEWRNKKLLEQAS
jgi:hypothetical protein